MLSQPPNAAPRTMLKAHVEHVGMVSVQGRWAARTTYRDPPLAQTPTDPDADMKAWLRAYATKHPCHGLRRACAALRCDERGWALDFQFDSTIDVEAIKIASKDRRAHARR